MPFNQMKSHAVSDLQKRISTSLLARRKTINTTRLVASSKVLQRAIPTANCDVIMTLPIGTDDATLLWLLSRLRAQRPDLVIHVRHWRNTGVYAFYMTLAYEDLLKGAEKQCLFKPLKPDFGGGKKEFVFEDRQCYEGAEDEHHFVNTEERQNIVYQTLLDVRALKGDTLADIKFLEGQSIVPLLQTKKVVSQVFPLHETSALSHLNKRWVQTFTQQQPLDEICAYFGVKIAMYFAYLGHYTSLLAIPTVLGVVVWYLQSKYPVLEDVCFVSYGLFNVFWASLYVEMWQRRSSELAYRWGTLDKKDELLQDPRPLFTGELVRSLVTGCLEPYYPSWKRNLFFYAVSVPVMASCLLFVFCVMLLIFELQEWVNWLVKQQTVPGFVYILPKILLALVIQVLDEIYKKIAVWLNNKENYRMQETYETHLIIKLVLFQFVNSFLSLFYIAFYIQDMDRLRDQLAALLITRQVIGNIRETIVPYVIWKMRLVKVGYHITARMSAATLNREVRDITGLDNSRKRSGDSDNSRERSEEECQSSTTAGEDAQHSPCSKQSELILTQAEKESTMKKYEDTFDDYLEMYIQYGYVILFSSAFPLAALCSFINNLIEIRSDAFKLCTYHQRPFGTRVQNIGIWQNALRVMGVVAVVVNCALIGVQGQLTRIMPDLHPSAVIFIIIALEHIILVVKMCVTYAIPSQPHWIKQEMARLEFQRRQALKSLEMSSPPPLTTGGIVIPPIVTTASTPMEDILANPVTYRRTSYQNKSPAPAANTVTYRRASYESKPAPAANTVTYRRASHESKPAPAANTVTYRRASYESKSSSAANTVTYRRPRHESEPSVPAVNFVTYRRASYESEHSAPATNTVTYRKASYESKPAPAENTVINLPTSHESKSSASAANTVTYQRASHESKPAPAANTVTYRKASYESKPSAPKRQIDSSGRYSTAV